MAAPFKRICLRAARSRIQRRHTQSQWQAIRPLSSTPSRRAEQSPFPSPDHHSAFDEPPETFEDEPERLSGVRYDIEETKEDLTAMDESQMSALAHRELEQHRELREMVRLAAWEMPLLSQHARPFAAPKENQILKWRYTTYMGETHPAEKKVVVEFAPSNIPGLKPEQLSKLLKLAGPRYNPETKMIKMSSDAFETMAQNKRYLADTINALITESQDPNADAFADVPLDLRHHKPKKRFAFPKEWEMTAERRQALEERRKARMLEEGRRVEEDRVVSGLRAIEEARQVDLGREEEAVMAQARRPMVEGKVGKKEMGQKPFTPRR